MSVGLTEEQKYHWHCPGCGFNPEKYDSDGDASCPKCGTEMRPPKEKYV